MHNIAEPLDSKGYAKYTNKNREVACVHNLHSISTDKINSQGEGIIINNNEEITYNREKGYASYVPTEIIDKNCDSSGYADVMQPMHNKTWEEKSNTDFRYSYYFKKNVFKSKIWVGENLDKSY